ncbi:hypothetical protein OESDEN_21002, partial [Oesophagostomum dentatum]
SGRYNDPIVAANTFKEDGGIIITIEYVQVHGAPVPLLDTLASPGYALSNRHGKVDVWDLHRLFAKVDKECLLVSDSLFSLVQLTVSVQRTISHSKSRATFHTEDVIKCLRFLQYR